MLAERAKKRGMESGTSHAAPFWASQMPKLAVEVPRVPSLSQT